MNHEVFEPSVLCLREGGPFADELRLAGIPVFVLENQRQTDYLSFRGVARIARAQQIDVLHTHNTHALVDGVIGGRIAGVKTVVHTDHARDFPDKLRYMVAEHLLSYLVYRFVGVSEHTSRNLHRYEKIPRSKIVTIPNGIDATAYDRPMDTQAKRHALGVTGDGPLIGLGARLTAQKGVGYLLAAMPALIARFPDITLLIAGEGDMLTELQSATSELGVESNVRFLGPRMDMPEILQILDVYVMPSIWEGLPMALLEAMAARCAVVATRVGGIPTALEDRVSGRLVDEKNPQQLADAITDVLTDAPGRDAYRASARNTFETRFSAASMARRYEALYLRQD
jgi:glycosyltransferase involved in cell wall biosynthesis